MDPPIWNGKERHYEADFPSEVLVLKAMPLL
jgi:hypothetical protein